MIFSRYRWSTKVTLFFLVFSLFALPSCSSYRPRVKEHYAREAYYEQEAEQRQPVPTPEVNQVGKEDLFVDLSDPMYDSDWERKPYEAPQEWLIRIQNLIELNQDTVKLARQELEEVQKAQEWYVTKINGLRAQNEVMKQMLRDPEGIQDGSQSLPSDFAQPFTVHLVAEGETLFSISMLYYDTGRMVNEIMSWNQGWIRNPDDLIAGVGLILFRQDAEDKEAGAVDRYIKQIRSRDSL